MKKRSTHRSSHLAVVTEPPSPVVPLSTRTSKGTARSSKRRVLGVDLSLTSTGLALVQDKRLVYSECVRPPGPQKACLEVRIDHVVRAVVNLARQADLIAVESPAYGVHKPALVLGEVRGAVRMALWERGFQYYMDANISTVKLFATGHGNASKAMMVGAAKPYFLTSYDHNQADALFIGLWAEAHFEELVNGG